MSQTYLTTCNQPRKIGICEQLCVDESWYARQRISLYVGQCGHCQCTSASILLHLDSVCLLLFAVIPYLIVHFGYEKLYTSLGGQLFTPMFAMFKPNTIRFQVGFSIILAGVLIGGFASLLAARKYLKMKR